LVLEGLASPLFWWCGGGGGGWGGWGLGGFWAGELHCALFSPSMFQPLRFLLVVLSSVGAPFFFLGAPLSLSPPPPPPFLLTGSVKSPISVCTWPSLVPLFSFLKIRLCAIAHVGICREPPSPPPFFSSFRFNPDRVFVTWRWRGTSSFFPPLSWFLLIGESEKIFSPFPSPSQIFPRWRLCMVW